MEILCFVNRIFGNYVFYSSSSALSTRIIVDTIQSFSTKIIVDLYISWLKM